MGEKTAFVRKTIGKKCWEINFEKKMLKNKFRKKNVKK